MLPDQLGKFPTPASEELLVSAPAQKRVVIVPKNQNCEDTNTTTQPHMHSTHSSNLNLLSGVLS